MVKRPGSGGGLGEEEWSSSSEETPLGLLKGVGCGVNGRKINSKKEEACDGMANLACT